MTNNPTPTNPLPSELREKIHGILYPYHTGDLDCKCDAGCHYGSHGDVKTALLELFEQELVKRECEARIDEIENIVKEEYFHPSGRHMGAVRYHVMRLRELSEGEK